jgi:hypothetical protein
VSHWFLMRAGRACRIIQNSNHGKEVNRKRTDGSHVLAFSQLCIMSLSTLCVSLISLMMFLFSRGVLVLCRPPLSVDYGLYRSVEFIQKLKRTIILTR